MYYQPSEVVTFVVAISLTPVMWVALRGLNLAGRRAFGYGYLAMLFAFTATIIEQDRAFALFDMFNTIEHGSLAVAGICFAVGAWQLRRAMIRGDHL